MAKKCEAQLKDETTEKFLACDSKAVKTYQNSESGEKKSFCKEHGPWLLPYSDGTWGEVKK